MERYSQNLEQDYILKYFSETGTLLDIGANDGKTLSNSLALIVGGWKAVLIEPAKIAFDKMLSLHEGNMNVICYNFGIWKEDGEQVFYSGGTHLGNGDTDLLSTTNKADMEKWQGSTVFTEQKIYCHTIESLLSFCPEKKFDFISIDAEGCDMDILTQMDLSELGCRMICVEHNEIGINKYIDYIKQFGMRVIEVNHENLIMAI